MNVAPNQANADFESFVKSFQFSRDQEIKKYVYLPNLNLKLHARYNTSVRSSVVINLNAVYTSASDADII
jgi:hypothetical protein